MTPAAPRDPSGTLDIEILQHRRTALVALHGELDLITITKVAEVVEQLDPRDDGVRHVVLDLRGLSFMDVAGLRELLKQNELARANHRNLAIVRGSPAIERLLSLTGVGARLVLVDDPLDLAPPPYDPGGEPGPLAQP